MLLIAPLFIKLKLNLLPIYLLLNCVTTASVGGVVQNTTNAYCGHILPGAA